MSKLKQQIPRRRPGAFAKNTDGAGRHDRRKTERSEICAAVCRYPRSDGSTPKPLFFCSGPTTTLTAAPSAGQRVEAHFSGLRNTVFEANAPSRLCFASKGGDDASLSSL